MPENQRDPDPGVRERAGLAAGGRVAGLAAHAHLQAGQPQPRPPLRPHTTGHGLNRHAARGRKSLKELRTNWTISKS
jgi:hypothetical protein